MVRRARPVRERIVPTVVERLTREFKYPEPDPGAQGINIFGGGAGGDPTVLVACSDASDFSKEMAHFILTGDDDGATLAAIQATVATSGPPVLGHRIVLSEGNVFVDPSNPVALADKVHLHGLGVYRTRIVAESAGTAGDFLVTMQTDSELSQLGFDTSQVGGYLGSVIDCDFGRISDITHVGSAATGIHFTGGQKPNSNIELNGSYSVAGIHIDGIRVKLDNVIINTGAGAGPRILIDNTATQATVITNLTIINTASGLGNGIETDGSDVVIDGFQIAVPGSAGIHVNDGAPGNHVITNGIIDAETGILMDGAFPSLDDSIISELVINPTGIGLDLFALRRSIVSDCAIYNAGEHGISLDEFSTDNQIHDNLIYRPGGDTDNTFDGILLVASADDNHIHDNKIVGRSSGNQPRYAINIAASSCDCNFVVGNMGGPSTDYGTGTINDAGTNTQLFYPSHPIEGDNLFDCPPDSS